VRLSGNLAAGLFNSVWSAIVSLAVVPFYLKYLGIEAYGLIGFFVTMQAVMQLLDLGLAPTINREVARCTSAGEKQQARNLLHSLAYVYWSIAALIAVLIYLVAPLIVHNWLQSNTLGNETVTEAIALMGLIIASRWPVGLYAGALMGAQRLAVSSSVSILAVTLSNFGAVIILAYLSPTLHAFFLWQALIGLLYALSMRWAAWHILKRTSDIRFELAGLKRIWRFSLGMSAVTLTGVILLQSDKLLLSRLLDLEAYGRYTLATVVASGLYVLLTPLFNTIYPHLTALVSNDDTNGLIRFYKTGTRLFLSILFPLAASVSIFSQELIYLWTGNKELSLQVAPVVSILILGTAFNGVMHFPYALQLAHGQSQIALRINFLLIAIMVPALLLFASLYGAIGGALAWFTMNFSYMLLGTVMTHRHILPGCGRDWLLRDVGIPLILTSLVVGAGGTWFRLQGYPIAIEFICGLALMMSATFIIILLSPAAKKQLNLYLQSFTT
jgi:O-antigen/teichoic acid export membrane protein